MLTHENDPEAGGCVFARFFETTPQELIQSGLFDNLAIPCFPGLHHTAPLPARLPRPCLCGWMMRC